MAEGVARAIDARTFAVPEAEHAVETAFAAQLGLLRAPDCGGRQLLVEARLEMDVVGGEQGGDLVELQVEAAERRAAIAGNESAGVQAGAAVARLLRQQQAHNRLRAAEQHARLIEVEAIGERRPGQWLGGGARSVVHGRPPDSLRARRSLAAPVAASTMNLRVRRRKRKAPPAGGAFGVRRRRR